MHIDEVRVRRLAEFFVSPPLDSSFAQRVVPRYDAPQEAIVNAMLWSSAICHGTKGGLKGYFDGNFFQGWDFLFRAFCSHASSDPESVSPAKMTRLMPDELRSILASHAVAAQVALSDLERRAEILRRLSFEVGQLFDGRVSVLLARSEGRAGGPSGAYSQLARLDAFRDPLMKKSSVFLMTMHFAAIWTAVDQDLLMPMIDYHRLRILCRTGCIVLDSDDVATALRLKQTVSVETERELRSLAVDVCRKVVEFSGMPMFEFDILLWAHARSCCRHHPVCVGGDLEDQSFHSYLTKPFDGRCEFQEWCLGHRDDEVRAIWEPEVDTEAY